MDPITAAILVTLPRYLIRDRYCAYAQVLIRRAGALGIRDRPISARSPWQNGFAERLIGSIRRDCLDHVIVFGERHLAIYSTHIIIRRMRTRLPTCLSIGLGHPAAILIVPFAVRSTQRKKPGNGRASAAEL
jgi:hypothetical protein